MTNNTEAISFWNFLKGNTIEIPIIQRDYAQGRLGKEILRKNFLCDLKNALDAEDTVILKLDFVYGSTEKRKIYPLDGQQRLTTLWLLHWYIALRAGKLNEENCNIFQRFTYETRISSREFCENLCNPQHFEKFDGNDIVVFITKQTWFYSAWKQDPTIQSMLRMLGGSKITDKNIADGIEVIFQETSNNRFQTYWEKLTKKEIIVFYHLPLQDFGLSDDLYIKMNARGKQLTSFENFKADLIGYITKQSENEQAEWKELLAPESGIPIKLDTDWTDIFWNNKSKDNKIDEIYFAFMNRLFLQELICVKKKDNTYFYSADDLEKNNGSFRHLYGDKGDDSRLQYSGIDKYLFYDEKVVPPSFFISVRDTLNNYKPDSTGCKFFGEGCLNAHFPVWVDSKFEFIPKYDEKGSISTLGQKERVVFLAVCRYFEKGGFDSISYKRWMRVVWNIVENSGIETISAMIGAMRLIDELSEHSRDIYKFLSNPQPIIKSDFAKDQINEEIAKAKQILDENGALHKYNGSDYQTWEEIIIEAEKYAFFKGAIRFLFTKINIGDDWKSFDTKWGNAQKYFDENGVKAEYKVKLTRALAIQCNNWDEQLYNKQIFNPNANTWKWILCSSIWNAPIHTILNIENLNNITPTENLGNEGANKSILSILATLPYEYFVTMEPNGRFRMNGKLGFYRPWGQEAITFDWGDFHRNELLNKLFDDVDKRFSIDPKIKVSDSFFRGWNIPFKFQFESQQYVFQWDANGKVYLVENGLYKFRKEDLKEYYCFNAEGIADTNRFINEIEKLIKLRLSSE